MFDVDGTLLTGSAATHVAAFAAATAAVCDAPDPFTCDGEVLSVCGVPINGLVDAQIARLCITTAGAGEAVDALLVPFSEALVSAYRDRVSAGAFCGELLGGVVPLLDELDRRGVACGLVTGNTEEICRLKLEAVGVADRFIVGGFGGVVADRAALFRVALAGAAAAGLAVSKVCYVADTPLDIDAAHRAGVPIVAVTTGRFSAAELAAAELWSRT